MTRTNKYGRTDYIPETIKLEVRKRCGFGCVNCGSPFYDYEHWNPEFKDLNTEPTADGITLCCPSCHRKKGGLLSMQEYEANIVAPRAFKDGFVGTAWSKGFAPEFILGNVRFLGGTRILGVDNETMLGFEPPEAPGAPPRLIARFFDRGGTEVFRINDNHCVGNPAAWDLTSNKISDGGWRWQVRHGKGEVDLVLELLPPDIIKIERMIWQMGPLRAHVTANGVQLSVFRGSGGGFRNLVLIQNCTVRSLKEKHSFLSVKRTIGINYQSGSMTIRHDLEGQNVELDGGGIGVFRLDPDAQL